MDQGSLKLSPKGQLTASCLDLAASFVFAIVSKEKFLHQRNLRFLLCFGTICQSAGIFLVDIRSYEGAVKLQHGLGTV